MSAAAALRTLTARFNRLTLRERALLGAAFLGGLLFLWDATIMKPLQARERAARGELETFRLSTQTSDATRALETTALQIGGLLDRERALTRELERLDAELGSAGAGMIEPRRMVEVVREVLARQRSLRLVSLRNRPVQPLLPPVPGTVQSDSLAGPFVHPIELVVEGDFFSVLEYLRELESLPWTFHWQTLELEAHEYPRNRVRLELSTLGMERAWIGV